MIAAAFYIGLTMGAICGVAVTALMVTAKQSDKQLAPQEIDDLLDSPQDNFDKRA